MPEHFRCQHQALPDSQQPTPARGNFWHPCGETRICSILSEYRTPHCTVTSVYCLAGRLMLAHKAQNAMQGFQPGLTLHSNFWKGFCGLKKRGLMPRWPDCPKETDSHSRVHVNKHLDHFKSCGGRQGQVLVFLHLSLETRRQRHTKTRKTPLCCGVADLSSSTECWHAIKVKDQCNHHRKKLG